VTTKIADKRGAAQAAPRDQVKSHQTTFAAILLSAAFLRGVDDFRKGAEFDSLNDDWGQAWNYERGRQWAAAAPRDFPLLLRGGRLNPNAVTIYRKAEIL
jgi:hypothetical protein